ncbi:hypothetical protein [Peribacillus sp. YIM B13482]|uniref:hypothetical protein n=1 Tax=Peribacillus sp. YIM B13482 TaxID=3366298 RepID=UPI00366A62F2
MNIPWKFVFVYKKDRTASVFIESYKKEGTDLIRSIASNHLEELRVLLGCEVELIRGSRNTDLYKLVAKLNFFEHQSFDECVSQYTNTFVKYQQFLKAKVRHS